jgi:hypothetical protein
MVTAEQFRITTREVVAERPEYVYTIPETDDPGEDFCKYVHGDEPGCVIGHVCHRLGVPLDELAKREGQAAADVVAQVLGITSPSVLAFAGDLQWRQDCGEPWGVALARAENYSPTKVVV